MPDIAHDYFPDDPESFRVNHPVGILLVAYAGGHFDKPDDTGIMVQARTARITVTTVLRQLNGRMGAVDRLDEVRMALVGFTPSNCQTKLRVVEEKFLSRKDGLWYYATTFETKLYQVEDVPDSTAPLAIEIIYGDKNGIEQFSVPGSS